MSLVCFAKLGSFAAGTVRKHGSLHCTEDACKWESLALTVWVWSVGLAVSCSRRVAGLPSSRVSPNERYKTGQHREDRTHSNNASIMNPLVSGAVDWKQMQIAM